MASDAIEAGVKFGFYPFTTNETLSINTAPAGTTEVLYLQVCHGGQTPASGSYKLMFTTLSGSAVTGPIAYNASAATIQAVIMTYPLSREVVVTGTALNSGMGSRSHMEDPIQTTPCMQTDSYSTVVETAVYDSAGTPLPYPIDTVVATPGVYGMTGGNSYTIDLYAFTSSILSVLPNGNMKTYNS